MVNTKQLDLQVESDSVPDEHLDVGQPRGGGSADKVDFPWDRKGRLIHLLKLHKFKNPPIRLGVSDVALPIRRCNNPPESGINFTAHFEHSWQCSYEQWQWSLEIGSE